MIYKLINFISLNGVKNLEKKQKKKKKKKVAKSLVIKDNINQSVNSLR